MTVKNPAAGGLSDNYFDMIREGFVSQFFARQHLQVPRPGEQCGEQANNKHSEERQTSAQLLIHRAELFQEETPSEQEELIALLVAALPLR